MKINSLMFLCTTIFLSFSGSLSTQEFEETEVCSVKDEQYDSNALKVVVNLFDEINIKDNIIESKDRHILELQDKVLELLKQGNSAHIQKLRIQPTNNESDQLAVCNRKLAEKNIQIVKLQSQIDLDSLKLRKCEDQLTNKTDLIRANNKLIKSLEMQAQNAFIKLNKPEAKLQKSKPESCLPFANSTGIHTIKIPDMHPFDVLCASAGTEPGWIVIQQRINGKEDFYRGWAAYRSGFGSFEGDFFLGLEKIHRLTTNRQHQLYIHMERFNGEIEYATYDHFAIAGEKFAYELILASGFSGNACNCLNLARFSTFDYGYVPGCAQRSHGAWWYYSYPSCLNSNLNGKYFDHEVINATSNFWGSNYSLKKVQMLIRPKFVSNS